jgi:hypothetical protein
MLCNRRSNGIACLASNEMRGRTSVDNCKKISDIWSFHSGGYDDCGFMNDVSVEAFR